MRSPRLAAVLWLAVAPLFAQSYEVYHQFVQSFGPPSARLVAATDGSVYGVGGGGDFGQGQIFRLVPDGGGGFGYERLYSLRAVDGAAPNSLIQGTDGRFYGTTDAGGAHGSGTAFAFSPSTGLIVLHDFVPDYYWGAVHPKRLLQASDGNLYGVTTFGGMWRFGVVFRLSPGGGPLVVLHDFLGAEGACGLSPLVQASDGYLYGATSAGGGGAAPAGAPSAAPKGGYIPPGNGTLFRIDLAGVLTALHSFSFGETPAGAFVEGPDGNLYTTAWGGGTSGMGSVYRSDKAGNLAVIHSFPSSADDGVRPAGDLVPSGDGGYYGVTTGGGTGGGGTVYRVTPDGAVTIVASFPETDPSVTTPDYGLALTTSGMLLGSAAGGALNGGVAFRVSLPGTGFDVVHEFGGPLVVNPTSPLVQTADGTLWGTAGGGSAGLGTVYRLSGDPMIVHEFSGAADGATPGALFAAPDGTLYGVTASQGAGGSGTVFHLDPSGTLTTLHAFSGPDGAQPEGGVTLASDGNFYGTTGFGGVDGGGTLYRLTSSGTHTKLHDFTANAIPEEPRGHIIQATDGMLYFTTFSSFGNLYRSDLAGNLTDLFDFTSGLYSGPPDGVIQADDGNLYGTTRYWGGAESLGSIFRFTLPSTFADLYDFSGSGRSLGTVVQGGDGRLYGTTTGEQGIGAGSVFVVDLAGTNFSTIRSLSYYDGDTPAATLLRAADGMLYGPTFGGGANGLGLVFRLDLASLPPSIADLAPASGLATGGVSLTIAGDHFHPGLTATVGSTPFATQNVFDVHTHFAVTPPLAPGTLNDVVVTNADGQFATLPQAYFADFLDAPAGTLFHDDIEAIFRDGITAGCGGGAYCGGAAVTRGQMAVFLLKEMHGASYTPPPCAGVFPDVTCPSMFADWIEELTAEGISAGCGGGLYCPQGFVPRQNAAVLLLKAEHGTKYVPPPCAGVFADVACPSTYADWIEQLAAEGITGGCGDGTNYCPTANSTRGQMAVFLEKTSSLP